MQSLWMIAASALFACMGVCVKLGASLFSAAELVFYRGVIALILLWGFVLVRRLPLATPHWRAHLWRGVAGSVSLVLYFYAISVLPLATAVTLNYTSPLFLALILAFWVGERVRWTLFLALTLGLAGVALLLRPSFEADQWQGGLAALASGAGAGIAYFNVRKLGRLGEPEWRTVFYFSLASAMIGMPWLLASQTVHAISGQGALLVLGVGGFGALAQLAMTRAYKRGSTLVSASLAYSTVIFASLFGMLLWDEVLPLSAWIAIGLIVASGLVASAQSRAPAGQD
ncbi:MAG: DMT family transporter [Rhodocyclales bacterium]|nr:DMT family transporter [Rhodocyclales bacterium]